MVRTRMVHKQQLRNRQDAGRDQKAVTREVLSQDAEREEELMFGEKCTVALCNYLKKKQVGMPKVKGTDADTPLWNQKGYANGTSPLSYNNSADNKSFNGSISNGTADEEIHARKAFANEQVYAAEDYITETAAEARDNSNERQRNNANLPNFPRFESNGQELSRAEASDWGLYHENLVDAAKAKNHFTELTPTANFSGTIDHRSNASVGNVSGIGGHDEFSDDIGDSLSDLAESNSSNSSNSSNLTKTQQAKQQAAAWQAETMKQQKELTDAVNAQQVKVTQEAQSRLQQG